MPPICHNELPGDAENTSHPLTPPVVSKTDLWIFPPDGDIDALPLDADPDFQHPPHPIYSPTNYPLSAQDPPQILIFYRGPQVVYNYTCNPPPMSYRLTRRIDLSISAHLRYAEAQQTYRDFRNHIPLLEEGTEIDLRYVDFPHDINLNTTRTEFGILLQNLAPPIPPEVGSELRLHTVSQWDIVCRRCGEAITHYSTDKFWNTRYIQHRKESECKNWMVPAGQAVASDE